MAGRLCPAPLLVCLLTICASPGVALCRSRATLSAACCTPATPPTSWHIHLLYNATTKAAAADFFQQLQREFAPGSCGGAGGTADTEYRGVSRTMLSCDVHDGSQWEDMIAYMEGHLQDLSAFVHPMTGCFKTDHLLRGHWLGSGGYSARDLQETSRWKSCDCEGLDEALMEKFCGDQS